MPTLDDEHLWQIADAELTDRQLEVYRLRHRHRLSHRQIALALDLDASTVRGHLAAADRRIVAALRKDAA